MSLLDLKNLNGNNGWLIPGKISNEGIGQEIYSAGDLNGDGLNDLIITATNAGIVNTDPYSYGDSDLRGKAYVIFGRRNGYPSRFDLDNLNGENGFTISGIEENHELGNAVSVGDLNGDGLDDLVMGASYAGSTVTNYGYSYSENQGEVYVIFGQRTSFKADFDLQSLNGSNGFKLRGIDPEDLLGTAISSAGDLNGDGFDDLAISASGAGRLITNEFGFTSSDRRGEVVVLFGKSNGLNASTNLALLNGNNGLIIEGKDPNDSLGATLSNAGDINGDGLDDLIIGSPDAGEALASPFANGDSDQRGEVYVVFGRSNGFNSRFNIAEQLDGIKGFVISGSGIEDNLGSSLSNAGDLNGDGIDDLILGAAHASVEGEYTQEGQVYVIFGTQNSFGSQFELKNLNGNNGFSISGIKPDDNLGNAVSIGDFNGDGIDDLLIGANTAGETISAYGYDYSDRRGEAYIIFGNRSGFTDQIDLTKLDRNAGLKIVGLNSEDLLGSAVSIGGDLNGDGADDLIVSAPGVDLGGEYTQEGTAYVVFGTPQATTPQIIQGTPYQDELFGGSGRDRIAGNNGNDTIVGNDGNDLLQGEGDRDYLLGGGGSDTLLGGDNGDILNGGADSDLLQGEANQDELQGESGADTLYGGADNDRLFGGFGDDILNGTNPDNFQPAIYEQDTLIGGVGADLFVLGDRQQVYYNDRNPNDAGATSYGVLEDFNPQQDRIQLRGSANDYQLSFYDNGRGGTGANLLYVGENAVPERIGIFVSLDSQLTLEDVAFSYVAGVTPNQPSSIVGQRTPYNDQITGSFNDDRINGDDGNDTIVGNDGNDLLNGDSGGDSLSGANGSDTLNGGSNNDFLNGGADSDLLDGGDNQDELNGESGADTLYGGTDNDRLFGGFGDDILNGTNPDNFQPAIYEQDTLIGGVGADLFVLGDRQQVYYNDRNPNDAGATSYGVLEDFNPQQDRIQLRGSANDYQLSFYDNGRGGTGANLLYVGENAVPERIGIFVSLDSQLTLEDVAFSYVAGVTPNQPSSIVGQRTPYNDQITGSFNDDRINGDDGNDTIVGNDGNDLLNGDSGGDSLSGANGSDTLNGGSNNDFLNGGADSDLLDGGDNQDELNGESGADTLYGGTDNDRLFGGFGDDILNGTNPDNFQPAIYEQDTLIGGVGADLFVLGDRQQVYYNDRNPNDAGATSYGVLEDFNLQQDRIQLRGSANDYQLSFYDNGRGGTGANLLYVGENAVPERIGIFDSLSEQVTLDNAAFSYL